MSAVTMFAIVRPNGRSTSYGQCNSLPMILRDLPLVDRHYGPGCVVERWEWDATDVIDISKPDRRIPIGGVA